MAIHSVHAYRLMIMILMVLTMMVMIMNMMMIMMNPMIGIKMVITPPISKPSAKKSEVCSIWCAMPVTILHVAP